jgi:hypothetical protein
MQRPKTKEQPPKTYTVKVKHSQRRIDSKSTRHYTDLGSPARRAPIVEEQSQNRVDSTKSYLVAVSFYENSVTNK